jgi:hypothetical protein
MVETQLCRSELKTNECLVVVLLRGVYGHSDSSRPGITAQRRLKHQKLADVVHRQNSDQFPTFEYGQSPTTAALKSSQREVEHLSGITGFESFRHRCGNSGLRTLLRETLQEILSGQHAHKSSLLQNRKVVLKTGQNMFDRFLQ